MKEPGAALALLHYLATAGDQPAEFQLGLAKLLCGLVLEDSVLLPESLPIVMKDEADQLLASAIGHWSVLKDTSVSALREGFLQRPGKLSINAEGEWRLQVEQRAYDMLLQQLPWSINLIHLPWMTGPLFTEWVD
jgi:hypothetical protein